MDRLDRGATQPAGQDKALADAITTAIAHVQAGLLDQAIATLQSGGGLALKHPMGQNIQGDILLKQGQPRDALKAFDAAVKMSPSYPEAHVNRGVALQALGRLDDALAAADRALRYRPNHATAHFNRGNILRLLGRLDEAIAAFDRALLERPAFAEARLNRSIALIEQKRTVEALAELRRAQSDGGSPFAIHLARAKAHHQLGQKADALAAVNTALSAAPTHAEALILKVSLLCAEERLNEALAATDQLIDVRPASGTAHAARSDVLRKLDRFDEALAEADESVRCNPRSPNGHSMRAMALSELNRVEEQLEALETAKSLGAADSTFYHAQGIALAELGDLSEARAAFERALLLEPDAAAIHFHYGMLLLSCGDLSRGWAEHEWRLRHRQYKRIAPISDAPFWQGEDLTGKKVLILREQGHGDNIQFVRFAPAIAAMAGSVTLTALPSLRRLLHRVLKDVDVTERVALRTAFDFQIGMMSLPHRLGATLETIPRAVPYLFADDALVAKWRDRLGADGFKVGIAWQGNPDYGRDRYRSVRLGYYAPLAAIPGVRLISIQAVNGLDQLADLPVGMAVENFGTEVSNNPDGFNEVAGLMANLDLVISSDTVTVHLAGALGRPTWVALRYRPDWRWLTDRADSPWYPTMRLFRQKRHNDWEGVFAEIAAALAEKVTGSQQVAVVAETSPG
jgi:tetratricopeptide (TPR) repeat protein